VVQLDSGNPWHVALPRRILFGICKPEHVALTTFRARA
jgi:hypothetical protein